MAMQAQAYLPIPCAGGEYPARVLKSIARLILLHDEK